MTCFPLQFSRLPRISIGRSAAPVRSSLPPETAIAPPPGRRKDRQRRRQSSLSVMNAGGQAGPETRPCPRPSPGDRKPARTLAGKVDGTDVLLGNVEFQHRHAAQLNTHAEGRVERVHGTHQDRLVKKLRRKGIISHEAANVYLRSEYLTEHNRRFARAAARKEDYHRRTPRAAMARDRRAREAAGSRYAGPQRAPAR